MAVKRYTNRQDLYTSTYYLLTGGVNNVEVSPEQYDAVCNSALDEFYLEGNDAGASFEDHGFLQMTSGVSIYPVSAISSASADGYSFGSSGSFDIVSISNFSVVGGFGNVNQLFTAEHNLLTDQNGKFRLFNNDMMGGTPGMEMASYYESLSYLDMTRQLLEVEYTASLREQDQTIVITPTPRLAIKGLLTFYRRETELNTINNILFRNLFKAMLKELWGQNIFKYNVGLPGGGQIEGSRIIQEAREDKDKALERIKSQAFPTPFSVA